MMNTELIDALKAARLHIQGEPLPTKVQALAIIDYALASVTPVRPCTESFPPPGSITRYCPQQQRVVLDAPRTSNDSEERVATSLASSADAMTLLTKIVSSDIGRVTLGKLERGQGTNTDEGQAWLAAAAMVSGGVPAASGKALTGAKNEE